MAYFVLSGRKTQTKSVKKVQCQDLWRGRRHPRASAAPEGPAAKASIGARRGGSQRVGCTDQDETPVRGRPIILNGIENVVTRDARGERPKCPHETRSR
jgi:hypothetical protein